MSRPFVLTGRAHEAGAGADFTWFVYGSALDDAAFRAWAEGHGYPPPDLSRGWPARLAGWRLSFDVRSRAWDGAVASMLPAPGRFVEGLAVPMPGDARGLADHKEGAISGLYRPIEVEVLPLAGGLPVPAIAYVATDARRLAAEEPPAKGWMDVVIRGARAHRLDPAWIAELERLRG